MDDADDQCVSDRYCGLHFMWMESYDDMSLRYGGPLGGLIGWVYPKVVVDY